MWTARGQRDSLMRGGRPLYVDVSPLLEKKLTGIARFMARLTESLLRLAPVRLFTGPGGDDIVVDRPPPCGVDAGIESWVKHLLRQPRQPHDHQLAAACAGLYGVLRPAVRHFRREVGILYDFTTALLPWAHAAATRDHFGGFFSVTAPLCDHLVAISRSTKLDARWLSAAEDERVVVGYPGPSMCVSTHAHPGSVERRDNVILVVSALEPRKNGPFLLDWFTQTGALPAGMELWWVGPRAWWASRELMRDLQRKQRSHTGKRIRLLGMVSDAELCRLYRQATFTIYPSLYEGFGFPVLDSLMHGAPVASSYHSSLKELETPGVFYFDACDPASLDDACRALLTAAPVTIDREGLAARFSWDNLGRTVLGLCA